MSLQRLPPMVYNHIKSLNLAKQAESPSTLILTGKLILAESRSGIIIVDLWLFEFNDKKSGNTCNMDLTTLIRAFDISYTTNFAKCLASKPESNMSFKYEDSYDEFFDLVDFQEKYDLKEAFSVSVEGVNVKYLRKSNEAILVMRAIVLLLVL